MTAANVVAPIVEGASGILGGLGEGAVNFFETIFLNAEGQISALGTLGLVGAGISMAIGIMAWIRTKV